MTALAFTNPSGLYDPAPNGYSHLAQVPAGWRTILPAGQGGETADGTLPDDFRAQLLQAIANTRTVLAAAGATLTDVAKITLLVVYHGSERFVVIKEEMGRAWPGPKPAMTLIPVPRLALPSMLVEIGVIAAVAPDAGRVS